MPEGVQGSQAWDRYAYVNNNPLRYTDPSGNMLDPGVTRGGGGENNKTELDDNDLYFPHFCETNKVNLIGGPGTVSYGKAAENSYDQYYGSGAHPNLGWVAVPGLMGDILVYYRDNLGGNKLFNSPEVWGRVYFEITESGLLLQGATITNASFEEIGIRLIRAQKYSDNNNFSLPIERLYPVDGFSIQPNEYGIVQPGNTSGLINFISSPYSSRIYDDQYVIVSINLLSASGRWGLIQCEITNP